MGKTNPGGTVMKGNIWVYILVSGLVSYVIRVTPLTLIRKPITNRFIRSFLYYVPYATLAVMTFPAIMYATQNIISGLAALIIGAALAWNEKGLPTVAAACCLTVFILELIL